MDVVSFTRMADGTKEDYEFLHEQEQLFMDDLPARLMDGLKELSAGFSGYAVSRLEHSLQSATRAHRAGESEELVVAALLHDICLLYTSPSPRDQRGSRMPSSA